jgi:D-glycero-alpha-D-manno-heptose 1-phosphate guanylyltransferase
LKAIVLCGGLGTRLGSLTRDMPKPLIEVAGQPFLTYVLDQLVTTPIDEIVMAVSYQWQKVQAMIGDEWRGVKVSYSIEQQPLGTGGAIKQALAQFHIPEAIVVNGDTLLKCDVGEFTRFAQDRQADICMALKTTTDTARFGKVNIDRYGRVISFEEKGRGSQGLINSGVYFVKAAVFSLVKATAFSFEKDILTLHLSRLAIYGMRTDAYFIDMGVPEDLARAQDELAVMKEKHGG